MDLKPSDDLIVIKVNDDTTGVVDMSSVEKFRDSFMGLIAKAIAIEHPDEVKKRLAWINPENKDHPNAMVDGQIQG